MDSNTCGIAKYFRNGWQRIALQKDSSKKLDGKSWEEGCKAS